MADSKSPFRPSFLKIERAQQHIAELEVLVAGYIASEPASVTTKSLAQDQLSEKHWTVGWHTTISRQPAPEMISPIIGDVFHNLRSALDLMASALATLNGKSTKKVYFPFADSAEELKKQIVKKNFNRAGPEAEELLWEWEPYIGGNSELRAIHDLNVRDKHRELIPQRISVGISGPIIDTRPDHGGPPEFLPNTEKVNSIQLVFPEDCALRGMELISTLHKLVDLTTGIVESFEALRGPSG